MNKEKEIEEMANAISKSCEEQIEKNRCASLRCEMCMAEFMIEAGCRKADEVRKETAKEIYERVEKWLDEIVPHTREETLLICLLGWIKTKYDVYNDFDEVDE